MFSCNDTRQLIPKLNQVPSLNSMVTGALSLHVPGGRVLSGLIYRSGHEYNAGFQVSSSPWPVVVSWTLSGVTAAGSCPLHTPSYIIDGLTTRQTDHCTTDRMVQQWPLSRSPFPRSWHLPLSVCFQEVGSSFVTSHWEHSCVQRRGQKCHQWVEIRIFPSRDHWHSFSKTGN